MCHVFAVALAMIVPPFQCSDLINQHNLPDPCSVECHEKIFDKSFWKNTVPMEFGQVCDESNMIGDDFNSSFLSPEKITL